MKRFLKSFRHGQRGFTLIELLVVVAILGILAIVVVPNVANMLRVADVAAANTEAANVELAAIAYLAENNGVAALDWNPVTSTGSLAEYLTGQLKANYALDEGGMIVSATPGDWGTGIVWNGDGADPPHQWVKS